MREYTVEIAREQPHSTRLEMLERMFGRPFSDDRVILTHAKVPESGIVLITGWSGAGKSSLLREILTRNPGAQTLPEVETPSAPTIDLFGDDTPSAIRWAGGFGLGEARVLSTPFANLSDGQQWRVRLALLLARRPAVVVIDEFLSLLDRTTAQVLAHSFQKICRRLGIIAYVATAHDDVVESLGPDHVVRLSLDGRAITEAGPSIGRLGIEERWVVGPGERADWEALARFHYLGGAEQIDWTCVREIRVAKLDGMPIAVHVASAPFRPELAVMEPFRTLNERVMLRTRTVVHPAFRGTGLTRQTETIGGEETVCVVHSSAMGRHVPFLDPGQYVPVEHPWNVRTPDDDSLERTIAELGRHVASLHDYQAADAWLAALAAEGRARVWEGVSRVLRTRNPQHVLWLAAHAGVDVPAEMRRELRALFDALLAREPPGTFGIALSEALHYPMQWAIRTIRRGNAARPSGLVELSPPRDEKGGFCSARHDPVRKPHKDRRIVVKNEMKKHETETQHQDESLKVKSNVKAGNFTFVTIPAINQIIDPNVLVMAKRC